MPLLYLLYQDEKATGSKIFLHSSSTSERGTTFVARDSFLRLAGFYSSVTPLLLQCVVAALIDNGVELNQGRQAAAKARRIHGADAACAARREKARVEGRARR